MSQAPDRKGKLGKLGKFHRVQSSGRSTKPGSILMRNSVSGKVTVSLSKSSYDAAKDAANRVMNKKKQPA